MYKTGRVYKIISTEGNECYVGSTFDTTRSRLNHHKGYYKRYLIHKEHKQLSVYDIFDKYGIENCRLILIKEYEVVDRRHLEVYETLWIKKLKSI